MKVPDKHFVLEKARKYLREDISGSRYLGEAEFGGWEYAEFHADDVPHGYEDFKKIAQSEFKPIKPHDHWGGRDRTAWFKTTVDVPQGFEYNENERTGLRLHLGRPVEGLVYVNGVSTQGIDVWHHEIFLNKEILSSGKLEIAIKAWATLDGHPYRVMGGNQFIRVCKVVDEFYFTADVLAHSIPLLNENDLKRFKLTELLKKTFTKINFLNARSYEYYESIEEALAFLKKGMDELRFPEVKPSIHAVGHSHIDMAWLWRLSATREKASRTFSTVLNLMWQYPDYFFMHSSPQLFKFLEEDYPELFARVKEKIKDGQWEATGAMWVESDTNVPSGESLVRQFLYGKRYFQKEFDHDNKVLWLPDVFGYSAALPQIAKKAGVDYFMTTKISWNQFNHFPHDTFMWRGLDGTELFTHFVTTASHEPYYTYNGHMIPSEMPGSWANYKQKDVNSDLLLSFGWGDGGGGPTREMLETRRALQDIPGIPYCKPTKVEPYFEMLGKNVEGKTLESWDGELYFEYHRGTYTSQGYNKKSNRQMEVRLHDGEFLSLLKALKDNDYPQTAFDEMWERVLLLQFHDIIPGSSIREVYEDCRVDYGKLLADGQSIINEKGAALTANIKVNQDSVVVYNTLSFVRDAEVCVPYSAMVTKDSQFVDADGNAMACQAGETGVNVRFTNIPAMGYKSFAVSKNAVAIASKITATTTTVETPFYTLTLNDMGEISSLFDKEAGRMVNKGNLNELRAFEDKPMQFDAWDIDVYYKEKPYNNFKCTSVEVVESGGLRTVVRRKVTFNKSEITQDIIFYAHTRRIDFVTNADWQERQVLLKASFPLDVRTLNATYDIQFGHVERANHNNDERDFAQFEVCGHKWADVSEGAYGVSLINDCKYGHDCKDSVLQLTLIKSPIDPDETADRCVHEFSYALYPHIGNLSACNVQKIATEFNSPAPVFEKAAAEGEAFAEYSMLQVSACNVIVDTVKKAEDDSDIVLRVFENSNRLSKNVTITFDASVQVAKVEETNLLEKEGAVIDVANNAITFDITPFEIKTFKIAVK